MLFRKYCDFDGAHAVFQDWCRQSGEGLGDPPRLSKCYLLPPAVHARWALTQEKEGQTRTTTSTRGEWLSFLQILDKCDHYQLQLCLVDIYMMFCLVFKNACLQFYWLQYWQNSICKKRIVVNKKNLCEYIIIHHL